MVDSARTPLPPREPAVRGIATAGIVALVARGMTARQILRLFPEFTPEDIRAALLQAADLGRALSRDTS